MRRTRAVSRLPGSPTAQKTECRIDLERFGPHDWQLVNAYSGRQIEHIKVQTWVLGISTIANVYPVA